VGFDSSIEEIKEVSDTSNLRDKSGKSG